MLVTLCAWDATCAQQLCACHCKESHALAAAGPGPAHRWEGYASGGADEEFNLLMQF